MSPIRRLATRPAAIPSSRSGGRDLTARARRLGLSAIEALVGLAISTAMLAQAPASLDGLRRGATLSSVAALLETDLARARAEAQRSGLDVRLTLVRHADGGSCYVVWRGAAGAACVCDAAGRARCEPGADADLLRLETQPARASIRAGTAAAPRTLVFSGRHGTVTPTATFSVADGTGREVRRIVNVLGRVRGCQRGVPADGPACPA